MIVKNSRLPRKPQEIGRLNVEYRRYQGYENLAVAIGLVNEGDTITIDVGARAIEVEADLDARRAAFKAPDQSSITGAIGKYVRLVRSASEGAVTSY